MNQDNIVPDNKEFLEKIDQSTIKSERNSKKFEMTPEKYTFSEKNPAFHQTHKNFYALYLKKGLTGDQPPPSKDLETLRAPVKLKEIRRNNSVQPLIRQESSFNQ